jgi:hypothetical protein
MRVRWYVAVVSAVVIATLQAHRGEPLPEPPAWHRLVETVRNTPPDVDNERDAILERQRRIELARSAGFACTGGRVTGAIQALME